MVAKAQKRVEKKRQPNLAKEIINDLLRHKMVVILILLNIATAMFVVQFSHLNRLAVIGLILNMIPSLKLYARVNKSYTNIGQYVSDQLQHRRDHKNPKDNRVITVNH